ncbi:hypothetical protein [Roseivivax marinus]|uniref:hypothetical protein n=1 Tax=Roseivivax marinus TaxID=1379903 RepID=UPI00273D88AC|nr:hypothetical protein [Roseivivax marinus]
MDGTTLIATTAPVAATAQHASDRGPEAATQPGRADFARALARGSVQGLALEAPFRAPPPVSQQTLPPAGQGYAAAREATPGER